MVAIDRPGYGSSAAYPDAVAQPEQRVRLAYGAVDRVLGERPRGAGLFLMAHSGGCELAIADGCRRACRAAHGSARRRTGRHRTPLPSRGARDSQSDNPGASPGRHARTALAPNRTVSTRGAQRRHDLSGCATLRRPRWCRTGPARTFRRSRRGVRIPVQFSVAEHEKVWQSDDAGTGRDRVPVLQCAPAFRSTNNPGPGTTSASATPPRPTTRRSFRSSTSA